MQINYIYVLNKDSASKKSERRPPTLTQLDYCNGNSYRRQCFYGARFAVGVGVGVGVGVTASVMNFLTHSLLGKSCLQNKLFLLGGDPLNSQH